MQHGLASLESGPANLFEAVWASRPIHVLDARAHAIDELCSDLSGAGVLKLSLDNEDEVIAALKNAGALPLAQYEAVRAGQTDPFVLETVAEANAPGDATSPRRPYLVPAASHDVLLRS